MFFIVDGEVTLYRNKNSKQFGEVLKKTKSFGEVEYFKDCKNRLLLAKASGEKGVTCYTLSYEVCSKYFPKMIDKEVEDLKNRTYKVHDKLVFKLLKNEFKKENLKNMPELRSELIKPESWDILMNADDTNEAEVNSRGYADHLGDNQLRNPRMGQNSENISDAGSRNFIGGDDQVEVRSIRSVA